MPCHDWYAKDRDAASERDSDLLGYIQWPDVAGLRSDVERARVAAESASASANQAGRDAQQEERCARRAEVESQIAGVLNDDQLVQFDELNAKRSAKMAERAEKMASRMAERGEEDGGESGQREKRGKHGHRGPPMDAC